MSVPRPGGSHRLGDRTVARIGFGAMQLSPHHGPAVPRADALAVLRRARELGIDHLDTAQFYGAGEVNALIREALHPYDPELVLATKVGAETGEDGGLVAAQRPEQLRAGVQANLRALAVERIEVVNLRRVDAPPGIVATGDQVVDLEAQLAELVAMRDEGLIGAIGLSNVSAEQLRAALPAGIACVQNAYSLLDRAAEPTLELCRERGIAWVPFIPLGSAFPHLPKVFEDPVVVAIAAELGATPAQVGLAWLLHHAPDVLLIPGTARLAHLEENTAAGAVALSPETMARLEAR
jgi:pyridoxine 4-dehydrogenase